MRRRAAYPAPCPENGQPVERKVQRPTDYFAWDRNVGDWLRSHTEWHPRIEKVVPEDFSPVWYVDNTGELATHLADAHWQRRKFLREVSCVIPDAQVWLEHLADFRHPLKARS